MEEKNKENRDKETKKEKKSIFSLFHKKDRYNWDIKKERARDKRLVDSFNFAIDGMISAFRVLGLLWFCLYIYLRQLLS